MVPPKLLDTKSRESKNTRSGSAIVNSSIVLLLVSLLTAVILVRLPVISSVLLSSTSSPALSLGSASAAETSETAATVTAITSSSQPQQITTDNPDKMSWFQKQITLPASSRGSYLITDTITRELPEIKTYKIGLLHLFIQHTSCALSLNENWDEDVRADMSDALDRIAPEDRKGDLYRHSAEGLDDMPAHIKSALVGASVTVPIRDGKLATGTWQGVWYLEFRARKHERNVIATIQGEKKS